MLVESVQSRVHPVAQVALVGVAVPRPFRCDIANGPFLVSSGDHARWIRDVVVAIDGAYEAVDSAAINARWAAPRLAMERKGREGDEGLSTPSKRTYDVPWTMYGRV